VLAVGQTASVGATAVEFQFENLEAGWWGKALGAPSIPRDTLGQMCVRFTPNLDQWTPVPGFRITIVQDPPTSVLPSFAPLTDNPPLSSNTGVFCSRVTPILFDRALILKRFLKIDIFSRSFLLHRCVRLVVGERMDALTSFHAPSAGFQR
jgi:hypothetical protein